MNAGKKNFKSADAAEGATQNPAGNGEIPYDPNQIVTLTATTKAGEDFGNVESTAEMRTCQETLRQAAENLLVNHYETTTGTVDAAGIHETVLTNTQGMAGNDATSETMSATPSDAVSPSLQADAPPLDEVGLPTGLEDRVAEQVRSVLDEVRAVFQEGLDLKITVKQTEEGRVFHFQSRPKNEPQGEPTSSETSPDLAFFTDAEVKVSVPQNRQSGENVVSLVADRSGQPVRLVSVCEAGLPTQAGESGSNATVNQAKIENRQTGLLNNQAAILNVAIAIGNVISVQNNS